MTGTANRLLSDGTYNYEYDKEGNRIKRTKIDGGDVTVYGWDARNRLIRVSDRTSATSISQWATSAIAFSTQGTYPDDAFYPYWSSVQAIAVGLRPR